MIFTNLKPIGDNLKPIGDNLNPIGDNLEPIGDNAILNINRCAVGSTQMAVVYGKAYNDYREFTMEYNQRHLFNFLHKLEVYVVLKQYNRL